MKLSTFLKDNNCYDEFVENFDEDDNDYWLENISCSITSAFSWKNTPQGDVYWDNIDDKWDDIENKENDMLWILEKNNSHYNKVTSNDELIIGEYYWCVSKLFDSQHIEVVSEISDRKIIGDIWAFEENNQALEKYDIYGPIPRPTTVKG